MGCEGGLRSAESHRSRSGGQVDPDVEAFLDLHAIPAGHEEYLLVTGREDCSTTKCSSSLYVAT